MDGWRESVVCGAGDAWLIKSTCLVIDFNQQVLPPLSLAIIAQRTLTSCHFDLLLMSFSRYLLSTTYGSRSQLDDSALNRKPNINIFFINDIELKTHIAWDRLKYNSSNFNQLA